MKNTTIRVTEDIREKIKKLTDNYNKKNASNFLNFLLSYLERNEIDLNVELKNGVYHNLKNYDDNISKTREKLLDRNEAIIKILRNFEKNYLSNLSLIDKIYMNILDNDLKKSEEKIKENNIEKEENKTSILTEERGKKYFNMYNELKNKHENLLLQYEFLIDKIEIKKTFTGNSITINIDENKIKELKENVR